MLKNLNKVVILVLVLGISILTPALAASEASVTVTNVPSELAPGSDFVARIDIGEVKDLNAAQYDITVDPAVLRLDDVTEGQIDSTDFDVEGFTEVAPGTYRILNSLGLGGVSGSGYLAVLHFQVVGSPGQISGISINGGVLSSMRGEIPATWTGHSLSIVSKESGGQEPSPMQPPSAPEGGEEVDEVESDDVNHNDVSGEETTVIPDNTGQDDQIENDGTPTGEQEEEEENNESLIPPENDNVGRVAEVTGAPESGEFNWPVVGGAITGAVVLGIITFSWLRRRFYWLY